LRPVVSLTPLKLQTLDKKISNIQVKEKEAVNPHAEYFPETAQINEFNEANSVI
jgi:hypothetical protein